MPCRFFAHLNTVAHHRRLVFINCCRAGIPLRGAVHDLSKYSPAELFPSLKYWTGTRSPNVGERLDKGYSLAWMHHKGRNRHHYEYWSDYDPQTHCVMPVKMPAIFVVEMFCDRVAASKTYRGADYTDSSPYDYYMLGAARRQIHPETARQIEALLLALRDEGEEIAFERAKSMLKKTDGRKAEK